MTRLFLSPPHMSGREQRYVADAFESNFVAPAGPMIDAFEREFEAYTGIPNAVAVASGTAAIHLGLKSLHLSDGDRVWASSLTFIASVVPVVHERLEPAFIDSDLATWMLDPDILREELALAARKGELPKAVISSDLYGQSCDLDEIRAACGEYEVALISDSAEAVGTRYKDRHAGAGALVTAFSFNGNKIITTSGGGMLAADDPQIAQYARYLSTQAREPVAHYEHKEVGFNYRMSNICAAIGRGQLQVLDERIARRRAIFELYRSGLEHLPGIGFMPEATYGKSTRWLTVITIDPAVFPVDREAVRLALEAQDIESRPVWKPMHLQPVFKNARFFDRGVSDRVFAQGLCLPSGSQMTDADVERVVEIIVTSARRA